MSDDTNQTEYVLSLDGMDREAIKREFGLNDQELLFGDAYLHHLNAPQAARDAQYTYTARNGIYTTATRLMRRPGIRAYISARLAQVTMPPNEILYRLTRIARGSIQDLLDDNGRIDLQSASERGVISLVRKYSENLRTGSKTVEMYSAFEALLMLAKYYHLWEDDPGWRRMLELLGYDADKIANELVRSLKSVTAESANSTDERGDT